jgi:hypothetical protein
MRRARSRPLIACLVGVLQIRAVIDDDGVVVWAVPDTYAAVRRGDGLGAVISPMRPVCLNLGSCGAISTPAKDMPIEAPDAPGRDARRACGDIFLAGLSRLGS